MPLCAVVIACVGIFVYNGTNVVKYVHDTERIGCRIYKYFIYSLGWFSYLAPFILTGILVEPDHGGWVGMAAAILLAFIYALLGDRLILSRVEAQDLSRNRVLKNRRHNFCYLLGLDHVDVYESFVLRRDVLAIQGPNQRRTVIIGSELLASFGQRQIDSLLLAALCEFKKNAPATRRLAALFYLPYALVLTLTQRIVGRGLVTSIMSFFFYPSLLIHQALLEMIKSRTFYDIDALEGFTETSQVQPTLYHLRLLQESVENRDDLEKFLRSFSLAHEGAQEGLLKTQGVGTYGRQE